MGVTQLWSVLQPCARPTRLETLNRKRLAVDASIWIYQFLKAVRDKEGNALRNSHVVGFFRRICKLLFFGIKPVFVFDGGAPVLKRETIQHRKRRREGRRDDAARTAGKLLAIQMQRQAEDAEERRKREVEVRGRPVEPEEEEPLPDEMNMVYAGELGMSQQERQQNRKFVKKDEYHLPELPGGIGSMGQPDDPRIMSLEELQEFSRQHDSGENIDVYDFSKIDFDGEFFRSLPAVDRYNILNAARLRSRLRMGLSKEQLEEMFPNRMDFSRFQVERVRERNELTQRLMNLNGMNADNMFGVGAGRIAGDRTREYILVKNDGVEGGWALGVVSNDKELGERNKPINVDDLPQNRVKKADSDSEDEEEFEDVPIEGLNRLPKIDPATVVRQAVQRFASRQQPAEQATEKPESMFVEQDPAYADEVLSGDEDEDLKRAIAMSLKQNFDVEDSDEDVAFEDVPIPDAQPTVDETATTIQDKPPKLASIVNQRAKAHVRRGGFIDDESDDDETWEEILAKKRADESVVVETEPIQVIRRGIFGGALPFERLDIGISSKAKGKQPQAKPAEENLEAGGFEREEEKAPLPLPPWLQERGDIRSELKEQSERANEIEKEDYQIREQERNEARLARQVVELVSSDDDSDIEMSEVRPVQKQTATVDLTAERDTASRRVTSAPPSPKKTAILSEPTPEKVIDRDSHMGSVDPQLEPQGDKVESTAMDDGADQDGLSPPWPSSPEPSDTEPDTSKIVPASIVETMEDRVGVANADNQSTAPVRVPNEDNASIGAPLEAPALPSTVQQNVAPADLDIPDAEFDVDNEEPYYSDPEEEDLLAQLDKEAEEHARFASTLNNKSVQMNQAEYEAELKQLRTQQKKDRRDADEVSQVMITECQALLRLFGLPYITAPMEAEAQCAELVELGLVDGIVTGDSDIFLFGGTRVYKNMFNSNKFVELYLLSDLEKELSLSRDKLIEFAHLLGSDYTEGLPGIGPVTALEIISEFPSEDGLQQFKDWWTDVQSNKRPKEEDNYSAFRRKFRKAQSKKLFLPPNFPSPAVTEAYLKPDVDHGTEPFQWGVPDLDNLRSFLMSTIGWTQERTDEVLVPVIRDMNRRDTEGTQTNITRYFDGAVGTGARDASARANTQKAIGSTRMKQAMERLKRRTNPALASDEAAESDAVEAAPKKKQSRKRTLGTAAVESSGDAATGASMDGNDTPPVNAGKGRGKGRAKRSRTEPN